MAEKHQFFNGMRFTRDESTGYYLCSRKNENGIRKRMHVYVWEHYNGRVPSGCHVHHIDGDKSNNSIGNLEVLKSTDHLSMHGKENASNHHDELVTMLREKAVPKSKDWHRSEDGRAWHKMHYEKVKEKMHVERNYTCQNCGREFTSVQIRSKFCSNHCKSAWRKKTGVDDVFRKCEACGDEFKTNKYTKRKYCSRKCALKAAAQEHKAS